MNVNQGQGPDLGKLFMDKPEADIDGKKEQTSQEAKGQEEAPQAEVTDISVHKQLKTIKHLTGVDYYQAKQKILQEAQ